MRMMKTVVFYSEECVEIPFNMFTTGLLCLRAQVHNMKIRQIKNQYDFRGEKTTKERERERWI